MNRKRLSRLAALPIAWLLLAAPLSARQDHGSLHDARDDEHSHGRDQLIARHADHHYLLYAEQGGDGDISRELAAYQRTRNDQDERVYLDRERQDSRQRKDEASRYYWWWPFRERTVGDVATHSPVTSKARSHVGQR